MLDKGHVMPHVGAQIIQSGGIKMVEKHESWLNGFGYGFAACVVLFAITSSI